MVGQVDEGRLVAGRYRLVERIGRGGMGTVWRAEDELLGRQVAVKKLHPPQSDMDDDELATLFERTRREARAAARISHPNVIVVHDVVDDAGLPSIVMEYVPSVTLGERLKQRGPLTVAEAARIGRGMVAALRAAHRAGVLHRDVKPGNVLLGEDLGQDFGQDGADGADGAGSPAGGHGGRVVLTDFGIAQASGTSTLTRTGELIGSIDFLSPERIRGAMPGPEADMWALGATLFQAVEGRSPFRRPTAIETAYAIAEEPVPAANAGGLTPVIAGLLVKEPGERMTAEEAERLLRLPAAEQDTAHVRQFTNLPWEPPTARAARPPGALPPYTTSGSYPAPGQYSAPSGDYASGPHFTSGGNSAPSGNYAPSGNSAPAGNYASGVNSASGGTNSPGTYGPQTPLPEQQEWPDGAGQPGPGPQHPGRSGPSGQEPATHSAPKRRGKRGAGTWMAVVVATAVVAGVGAYAANHFGGSGSDPAPTDSPSTAGPAPTTASPSPKPRPTTPSPTITTPASPPPVPDGYHLYKNPGRGYSVPVPDGWTKTVTKDGEEVDFVDPTQKVDLKISSLDFASTSPYNHFKSLAPETAANVDGYHLGRLWETEQFGDPAALWEFTFQGSVPYHAIDLGFGKPGGTEYAVYVSAPESQWDQNRTVFNNATAGFRQSGG